MRQTSHESVGAISVQMPHVVFGSDNDERRE